MSATGRCRPAGGDVVRRGAVGVLLGSVAGAADARWVPNVARLAARALQLHDVEVISRPGRALSVGVRQHCLSMLALPLSTTADSCLISRRLQGHLGPTPLRDFFTAQDASLWLQLAASAPVRRRLPLLKRARQVAYGTAASRHERRSSRPGSVWFERSIPSAPPRALGHNHLQDRPLRVIRDCWRNGLADGHE